MTKKDIKNLRALYEFLYYTDFTKITDDVTLSRLELVRNFVYNCWVADKLHNIYDDISPLWLKMNYAFYVKLTA